MTTIALKVEVDTFRGTQQGVPQLVKLFQSRGVNATFLFSLGPDNTGRALRQLLRQARERKNPHLSLRTRYGLATLFRGTLLPGRDIGRHLGDILRSVDAAGFEVGVRAWDSFLWQREVELADAKWVKDQLELAFARFAEVFGRPADVYGAPGCRMSRLAFRQEARMGIRYASDTRGSEPFWPIADGEPIRCMQLPVTLPMTDELVGTGNITPETVHQHLMSATMPVQPHGHVFALRAELEGMAWLSVMERLLDGWLEQGQQLISLGDLYSMMAARQLLYHAVETTRIPCGMGNQVVQGWAYPT